MKLRNSVLAGLILLLSLVLAGGQRWMLSVEETAFRSAPAEKMSGPSDGFGGSLLNVGFSVRRAALPAPFWTMAAEFREGPVFYGGTMDGRLVSVDEDGKMLWELNTAGIPSGIAIGDADGDGEDEIALTCLVPDKNVLLVSKQGKLIASTTLEGTAKCVAFVPRSEGRGNLIAVGGNGARITLFNSALERLGGIDTGLSPAMPMQKPPAGASLPAQQRKVAYDITPVMLLRTMATIKGTILVAGTLRGGIAAFDLHGAKIWEKYPLGWPLEQMIVTDLNGDGQEKLVVTKAEGGGIAVLDANGNAVWSKMRLMGDPTRIAAADLLPTEGQELYVFDNQQPYRPHPFVVFRRDGELLTQVQETNAPNVLLADNKGKRLWAASAGLRDAMLYEIRVSESGVNELAEIKPPQAPKENARKLLALAEAAPNSGIGGRRIYVHINGPTNGDFAERYREFREFNNDRVQIEFNIFVQESGTDARPGLSTMTADEIVAMASRLEQARVPFYLAVCHACFVGISENTVRRVFDAAPNWSRGLVMGEDFVAYPTARWRAFEDAVAKFLEISREQGKRLILQELLDTWHQLPADTSVYDKWFRPEHRRNLIPMFRTNNPHAPEWTVGGCVGLQSAGLVDDWGISPQFWNWNWQQIRRTEAFPDDVMLRMLVSSAALGSTYFHDEGGSHFLFRSGDSRLRVKDNWNWRIFHTLATKGWLSPPSRGELVSLAPFAFRMRLNPAFPSVADETLGFPDLRLTKDFTDSIFHPRWALERTNPQYVSNLIYRTKLYCSAHFPMLPYGFVPVVPEEAREFALPGHPRMILTDGFGIFRRKNRLGPMESIDHLKELAHGAAKDAEIRCEQAFMAARKVGNKTVVIVMDSSYPGAADAEAEVIFRNAPRTIRDALDGSPLRVAGKRVRVAVPAGAFRILLAEQH